MGTQETIVYQLVLTNSGFGLYLPFLNFWVLKKGTASKSNQKVDPLGETFGSPVIMFPTFLTPPKSIAYNLLLLIENKY